MSDVITPADLVDERLLRSEGLSGAVRVFGHRIKGGELGNLPVIVGLVVICAVFYSINNVFLSPFEVVSMTQFAAPVGMISLGIVLVLLLGEIDLSVGSVSGFAAATSAVLVVHHGLPMALGILVGIGVGILIGCAYALLYTRVGVPSFVFSLAGLLAFQGGLLYVLGKDGTINLPPNSGLVAFARSKFLSPGMSYALVAVVVLVFVGMQLRTRSARAKADLSTASTTMIAVKGGALLVGLGALTAYVNQNRGWGYLFLLFVAAVFVLNLLLTRSTWGRHVLAVGGNEEAARRSGIKVNRIYLSVFAGCSTLAAVGGILASAQLTSVSQSSGTTDTNLTAIAAAVIGGTSLFGGRGSAVSALLGISVLQAIQTGLNVVNVDSSIRFMVTGAVLLLAVTIDSVSRKTRAHNGRG